MSTFMTFLDNIDNDIINETYVDDTIVEKVESKPQLKKKVVTKKPITVKKDSSIKLIEARIRTKLDSIGLNESAINDVVTFVLYDIQKIKDVESSSTSPTSKAPTQTKITVQENKKLNTVRGRAESLLEGLIDTPTFVPLPTYGSGDVVAESNFSNVADRASSLL